MSRFVLIASVLAIALGTVALAACGGDDDEAGGDDVTVELAEFDGSGQTGTATLTADGEQTRVVIAVDSPVSDSQPAHIHEGTCDDLTPEPAYGLPNVTAGSSDSTVHVSLDTLTEGDYAINLHMSDDVLATYTSCGEID
jgi:Cu/Zn superoxide dismutase